MHAQSQMLENCKIPISFNLFGNIQSVRCGHYAIWMYPFNITLFIFEYQHKMLPDPPLVTNPPLCGSTRMFRFRFDFDSLSRNFVKTLNFKTMIHRNVVLWNRNFGKSELLETKRSVVVLWLKLSWCWCCSWVASSLL